MRTVKSVLRFFFLGILCSALPAEQTRTGTLDGVPIEAVENYPNPKHHEIGLGAGLYPFKAYYTGFSLTGDYVYHFNKSFSWEVLRGVYTFTVQTDLTSQLAQDFKVNPQQIEKLKHIFSTNGMVLVAHGKLLLFNRFIRYFRTYLLGGIGVVTTTQKSRVSGNVGLRFDAYLSELFSWKLEFMNYITIGNKAENFASFGLSTGINF